MLIRSVTCLQGTEYIIKVHLFSRLFIQTGDWGETAWSVSAHYKPLEQFLCFLHVLYKSQELSCRDEHHSSKRFWPWLVFWWRALSNNKRTKISPKCLRSGGDEEEWHNHIMQSSCLEACLIMFLLFIYSWFFLYLSAMSVSCLVKGQEQKLSWQSRFFFILCRTYRYIKTFDRCLCFLISCRW